MSGETGELRLNDGAAQWLEQEGEVVVLDLNRSWYVGLNASAGLLWAELARGTTRARLVDRLSDEYDLDHEQAAADVDAFVAECAKRGLLG